MGCIIDEQTSSPHVTPLLAVEAADINTPPERLAQWGRDRALMPFVAANPATPASTLETLSMDRDHTIRRAVAHNPNTPLPALLRLADEFPQEFLTNAVIPLLNLSQPDFIKAVPSATWLHLLRCESLPLVWLKWLQQGVIPIRDWSLRQEVQAEAKTHVALAGEAGGAWEQQATEALQADERLKRYLSFIDNKLFLLALLALPGLAKNWVDELRRSPSERRLLVVQHSADLSGDTLAFLGRGRDPTIQPAVARHPQTPAKVLARLAAVPDPAIRRAVASNSQAKLALLHRLAGDSDATVRRAVAHHPHTALTDLESLALDADASVRAAVAHAPRLTAELYDLLVHDADPQVRAALARNVHAPPDVLLQLARQQAPEVRAAVARNPRLPAEAFSLLLREAPVEVLCGLAGNPRLPLTLLERLAAMSSPAVRQQLALNPRTPLSLLETWLQSDAATGWIGTVRQRLTFVQGVRIKEPVELWTAIARHPRTTPGILAWLAQSKNEGVRAAVAAHTRTPVETLRTLANQQNSPIHLALASNPQTPPDVLKRLLAAEQPEVWARIAHHPAVLRDQHRMLVDLLVERVTKGRALSGPRASDVPMWFRLQVLQHTNLPEKLQVTFAGSALWGERYLVARHARAAPAVLNILTHDGNRYVRAAARAALVRHSQAKRSS